MFSDHQSPLNLGFPRTSRASGVLNSANGYGTPPPSASSLCYPPDYLIPQTPVFSTLPKQRHRSPNQGMWELLYDSPSSPLPRIAPGPRRNVTVLHQDPNHSQAAKYRCDDPDHSQIAKIKSDNHLNTLLETILLEIRQLDVRLLALSRDLHLDNGTNDDISDINNDGAIATAMYEVLAPGNSHVDSRWEQSFQRGLDSGTPKWHHHQSDYQREPRKHRRKNPFSGSWKWIKRIRDF